jgi:type I restriction enzyme S subunit
LGDILEKIESGHSPVCLERTADEGEWGVLKLSSVTPGHYDWGENKALPGNVSPYEGNEVKQGDLLFVRKNTYELVGRTALVLETKPRLLLSDLIFRLVIKDPSSVEPSYLWFSLNHPGIHKRVQSQAGGAAGSMPNISKERLKKVSIPIPPVSLQHQFTDLLEKVESLRARQRESEKELEELFGSLMQRAFRGELV